MNKKANYSKNAGMTLVELLVAITILAIIVVPLLHAMASSARLGLRARQHLRTTTAAQDIMEGIKAESLENLSCSFNYPDDFFDSTTNATIVTMPNSFSNFFLVTRELVNEGDSASLFELRADVVENKTLPSYRNVSNIVNISARTNANMGGFGDANPSVADQAASTKRTDDDLGYEFYAKSNHKYFFAIQNMSIENDSGDPNFFVDALIELDGSNYTHSGAAPKVSRDPSKDDVLLNEQGRISYSATDEKRDAFFIEDTSLAISTAQEFTNTYRPATDCKAEDLSKSIIIETINHSLVPGGEKAADGVSDWITVTCKMTYTSSDAFLIPPTHENYDTVKKGNQPYTKTYQFTIFDNKSTGYPLENIYLCYYPGYKNHTNDEIIYVNPDLVPATLHIVKQERENNGTLNSDELHYRCNVKIQEGFGAAWDNKGTGARADSVTPIRTNLDYNMYQIYMSSAPNVKQATFTYNDVVMNHSLTDPSDTQIFSLGGQEEKSGQIFDVTIDIYEAGTLQKGFDTGSISNQDILFTLEGSTN